MSYYQDLGVSPTASPDEIRESYHNMVRLFHPDAQTDPALKLAAEHQMRRLNESHAILSDSEKRRHYDAELAAASERLAPIIIRAPRSAEPNFHVPWSTMAWGSAVIASAAAILWLSGNDAPVALRPPGAGETATVTKPAEALEDAGDPVTIGKLRRQLRVATAQRDEALRQLDRAHRPQPPGSQPPIPRPPQAVAPPRPLPEVAGLDLPPALRVLSVTPPAVPAAAAPSSLTGTWLWAKPRIANRGGALYPPEYIETSIVDHNGSLHGRYRARYLVADRAISPDVNFEFDGRVNGRSGDFILLGEGGAKGEVHVRLIEDNSLEIKWSASDLGKSQGLSAGSAILTRRRD